MTIGLWTSWPYITEGSATGDDVVVFGVVVVSLTDVVVGSVVAWSCVVVVLGTVVGAVKVVVVVPLGTVVVSLTDVVGGSVVVNSSVILSVVFVEFRAMPTASGIKTRTRRAAN